VKLHRPRDELRNHPGNRDDFDVIGPDGKIIGRILRPALAPFKNFRSRTERPVNKFHGFSPARSDLF